MAVLVDKILEFSVKNNIQFAKLNERPWGTYEPILSLDGQNWWHPGEAVGWGFRPEEVIVRLFTKFRDDDNLKGWLGPDRHAELEAILSVPTDDASLPALPAE